MKKHFILLALTLASMTAGSQTRPVATISTPTTLQAPMYCVSANGKYAAGDFGAVSLLDIETGEETVFYDAANEGSTAKGVTNDGTIVGQFGSDLSAPGAILKKGASQWEMLPTPENVNQTIEYAPQGVTPDGKYIAGYGYELNKGMYVPLMWTQQDDGNYTVEILPYPEKDIWGMLPQMVVCYGLSNDGTKAYGKIMDFTGFTTLGILYNKDAEGKWNYQILGEDWLIIDKDKNPGPQPQFEDYVTAEPGTDEYLQQANEFEMKMLDWYAGAEEYVKISISPSSQIQVNQNSMSGNGEWLVISTPNEARLYNTDDGTFITIKGSAGYSACSVTNAGDVVMTTPVSMPFRSAYICPSGKTSEGAKGLTSWLEENYDVKYAEGTEDGYTIGLGTCCITPDGKTIVGWNAPQQPGLYYVSSIVRIDDSGSTNVSTIESRQEPTITNGTLYIPEGRGEVSIYNVGGSLTATFTAEGSVDLKSYAKGVTIVKVRTGKLTKTFKVTL